MSNKVIPGILEKNWEEIEKKIKIISQFSDTIHVDFIDRKFAENLTFLDPGPFKSYSSEIFLEAHLMVEEPIQYLSSLAQSGFKRFLGHVEKMSNQEEFVAQGQLLGEVGLALDLDTPVSSIKVPFDDLDLVLLMSVKAGFSNQDFNQASLGKIKDLRSKTAIPIEIDGGINDKTVQIAKDAGADCFVSTSFITQGKNPGENYNLLNSLI